MPTLTRPALYRGKQDHPAYLDTEWQANAFAGAFAMPAKGLVGIERTKNKLSPELLADTFGVSLDAASTRLNVFSQRRDSLIAACGY